MIKRHNRLETTLTQLSLSTLKAKLKLIKKLLNENFVLVGNKEIQEKLVRLDHRDPVSMFQGMKIFKKN